jgi:murein DD-endopeptidase MepM/ murein hydrolase activator NlpD
VITTATHVRTLRPLAAVLVIAVLVGLAGPARAQSSEVRELRERMEANQEELDFAEVERDVAFEEVLRARTELEAVERTLADAEQRLAELTQQLTATEAALEAAVDRLERAVREFQSATKRLMRSQEALDQHLADLRTQIAAAYVYGGTNTAYFAAAVDAMSSATSVTEYLTTLDKLHSGAERKNEIVGQVEVLVAEVAARREEVERHRQQRMAEERDAREARDLIATLTAEQADVVAQIAAQHVERERILGELETEQVEAEERVGQLAAESDALLAELAKYRWHAGAPGPGGLVWPTDGRVTSTFGSRRHPILEITRLHAGIDIPAPTGQPVVAAADGKVVSAGARSGYGLTVVIAHGGGLSTVSAHLSRIDVKQGDEVSQGDLIGAIGSTGLSTGPHLHFEIRREGVPADPLRWY